MAPNRDTPAMRQYSSFKKLHPDALLLFRMGDFYELFDDDAVTAHRALGITLTQRSEGIPMAGVPYHSHQSYVRRLLAQGFRVVVADQVQDPREAKGIVERAVTRIFTPGTLVDEAMLDEAAPCNLAAVAFLDAGDEPTGRVGVAIVELSTGAFTVLDTTAARLADELSRRAVSEVLFPEAGSVQGAAPGGSSGGAPPRVKRLLDALNIPGTARPPWHFRPSEALEALRGHYQVASLAGFGLRDDDPAVPAAGAILRYLRETQALDTAALPTSEGHSSGTAGAFHVRPRSLSHILPPRRDDPAGFLTLDGPSLRALEVERTLRAWAAAPARGRSSATATIEGSLLGVFLGSETSGGSGGGGGCATAMGKRLLREWLCRPLADRAAIESRHARVGALASDALLAGALDAALKGVQDVARLAARVGLGRALPRDLVALCRSLSRAPELARAIEQSPAFAGSAKSLADLAHELTPLAEEVARTCVDDPPAHLREGGLVRDGIDAALDEARALQTKSGAWLAEYQARLIAEHDLPSLKVGFNKVFGYYIELPAAQSKRAPDVFSRKQTLKSAERYITPELKDYEDKALHAEERALQREQDIFASLSTLVARHAAPVARFGELAAELDALACFAAHAVRKGWTRPAMVDEPILEIRQGRHPVLDSILGRDFVPNDCVLGVADAEPTPAPELDPGAGALDEPAAIAGSISPAASLALITGPNMAGKSTYIRQTALIVLLAHAGSFVPAQRATIGLTDRIFTRIGADDALHAGQSTFMVEMVETASILHHATERSLVILDEIGRGTSTLDGLSLAWAIAERLALPGPSAPARGRSKPRAARGPRTLFATHYHELTDLPERPGFEGRIRNLHVAVREWPPGDPHAQIVFLHRILPGRASRSYGIHVARLAGIPTEVIARAGELLESLSVSHEGGSPAAPSGRSRRRASPDIAAEPGLFSGGTPAQDHPVLAELKTTNLDHLSPMQAFDLMRRLKADADRAP